jgi:hypothetical protein
MSRGRSAGRLYLLHVGLAAAGIALIAWSIALVAARTDFGLPSPGSVAAACDRWLSEGGPGAIVAIGVAGLALAVLLLGVRSARRQLAASRRYLRALRASDQVVTVDGASCRLIETSAPQAFCAGYLRPRIYLSRGAVETLSREELRAVVSHELHHVRRRDPLRLLLARSLADALFFIPLLRRSSERYEALGELAADEAAVRRLGGHGALASALVKFSGPDVQPAPVVGIAPERVDHLLGDPEAGRWRLQGSLAGRSAVAMLGLAALLTAGAHGLVVTNLDLPVLLAAGCMVAMIGGPVLLAGAAILLSRRALRARRA